MNLENYTNEKFYILYFASKYPLPSEIKENVILASPIGILSSILYLNHKHPIISLAQLSNTAKLIKYSHFPGSEGGYCSGSLLIPSKHEGYSIALTLPKL